MYKPGEEFAKAICSIISNIAALIKVKSFVTLAYTYGLIMLLSGKWIPSETVLALFSTSIGATMAYYFGKKDVQETTTLTETTSTPIGDPDSAIRTETETTTEATV
jgi:hypothetical protein